MQSTEKSKKVVDSPIAATTERKNRATTDAESQFTASRPRSRDQRTRSRCRRRRGGRAALRLVLERHDDRPTAARLTCFRRAR
jgi:hypothetical protein